MELRSSQENHGGAVSARAQKLVVSRKSFDEHDRADDGRIELSKVLARNPVLEMIASAGLLHLVAIDESAQHLEAQDIPLPLAGTFQSRAIFTA
ncbi:hypothetical protein ACVIJ6_004747 [Bradyrhizobium sp. USDA 4369]